MSLEFNYRMVSFPDQVAAGGIKEIEKIVVAELRANIAEKKFKQPKRRDIDISYMAILAKDMGPEIGIVVVRSSPWTPGTVIPEWANAIHTLAKVLV